MRVGVPGGDIVFVQSLGFVQQLLAGTQGFGQRLEQDGNRMSPRHAARFLDHRFDGFFGALLGVNSKPTHSRRRRANDVRGRDLADLVSSNPRVGWP